MSAYDTRLLVVTALRIERAAVRRGLPAARVLRCGVGAARARAAAPVAARIPAGAVASPGSAARSPGACAPATSWSPARCADHRGHPCRANRSSRRSRPWGSRASMSGRSLLSTISCARGTPGAGRRGRAGRRHGVGLVAARRGGADRLPCCVSFSTRRLARSTGRWPRLPVASGVAGVAPGGARAGALGSSVEADPARTTVSANAPMTARRVSGVSAVSDIDSRGCAVMAAMPDRAGRRGRSTWPSLWRGRHCGRGGFRGICRGRGHAGRLPEARAVDEARLQVGARHLGALEQDALDVARAQRGLTATAIFAAAAAKNARASRRPEARRRRQPTARWPAPADDASPRPSRRLALGLRVARPRASVIRFDPPGPHLYLLATPFRPSRRLTSPISRAGSPVLVQQTVTRPELGRVALNRSNARFARGRGRDVHKTPRKTPAGEGTTPLAGSACPADCGSRAGPAVAAATRGHEHGAYVQRNLILGPERGSADHRSQSRQPLGHGRGPPRRCGSRTTAPTSPRCTPAAFTAASPYRAAGRRHSRGRSDGPRVQPHERLRPQDGNVSSPARFIFDSEAGKIVAWTSPTEPGPGQVDAALAGPSSRAWRSPPTCSGRSSTPPTSTTAGSRCSTRTSTR